MSSAPGRIIGRAGVGLEDNPTWAKNVQVAQVGRRGEQRTAAALADLARRPGGFTLLNDLSIPGSNANVDHVIVYGKHVLLLDSKVWKAGTYWTLFGVPLRGMERVDHVAKKTMAFAHDRFSAYLSQQLGGVGRFRLDTPMLVVWPARQGQAVSTRFLSVPGAKAVPGDRAIGRLSGPKYRRSASDNVVAALFGLVNGV